MKEYYDGQRKKGHSTTVYTILSDLFVPPDIIPILHPCFKSFSRKTRCLHLGGIERTTMGQPSSLSPEKQQ